MSLTATQLHPLFAAEVSGIDLRTAPDKATCAAIDRLMEKHAVLVFRDQPLDDDQQMAFGEALGPLEPDRAVVDVHKNRLKHDRMNDISNLDVDGKLLPADDRRRLFALGNRLWHSDSSFKPTPAKYSMLHARVVPPDGGETEFADMRAAWDALAPKRQAALRDKVCRHSLLFSRGRLGFTDYTPEEIERFKPVRQRLVRFHPATNRHSLYLSSHIGEIEGMPRPEAMILIQDLVEFATQPAFVYAHQWRQGDLVVWDNRTTMHRARPFEDRAHARDLRRVTLTDVAPTLEQIAA